ncbi:MAG: AI-2E family transporter [Gammaproteobacteria bacterium]|nr:AI-2E family transporter [Gammaproteobacteria bacterium]
MSALHPNREVPPERQRWAMPAAPRSLTPLVLVVGVMALVLHELQTILLPFVIAAVTAYVCTPLVDWLGARTPLPRWLAALVVLGVLMATTAALAWAGVPPLLSQVAGVVADLRGAIADFIGAMLGTRSVTLFGSHVDAQQTAELVVGALQQQMNGSRLLGLLSVAAAAAFGFMLVWVLMGYFLIDGHAIGAGLLWLVPPPRRARAERIWRELDPLLRRYFVGVALVVAYATAAAYLGLGLVLGLHHALVLALLTGVLEIIPMVGPVAAAVIAGLVAVEQAATSADIWGFVLYAILLRLTIDQLVGPLVLGNAARVHPVVVIFGFLAGGALFGIVGMILAVPAAILVKVSLSVLYREAH